MILNSSDHRIDIPVGAIAITVPPVTVWETYSYAREWWSDAIQETDGSGQGSRRREVLFAVCAAESYIFEWVRDTVLNHDFVVLDRYFPVGHKRGVTEKFKEVPKQLAHDGLIRQPLDCGGPEFAAFRQLVEYRDGLVHASASRPDTSSLPAEAKPIPSRHDLDSLPAGWASGVIRRLLQKLHTDTGTPPPTWL
jgi:hypothetical protein